jgi:hypothetical protein
VTSYQSPYQWVLSYFPHSFHWCLFFRNFWFPCYILRLFSVGLKIRDVHLNKPFFDDSHCAFHFYIDCPLFIARKNLMLNYIIWSNKPPNETKKTKTNSVALSLQVNYTDWGTATCRRNLVPTYVDRRVSCGQRSRSPMVINLSFLDRQKKTRILKKKPRIKGMKEWCPPPPN